jgi:7-cyano-7-deazaguanine synthase
MTSALVILSGGQDSTTCLYWAKQYYDVVHAITFDYHQRHRRELMAAREIATLADVASWDCVTIGRDVLQGTSPLTDHSQPLETYPDFDTMDRVIGDRVELTFVPMRNALFLTIAANRAAMLNIEDIVTGVCQQDNANYPDCRQTFISAMQLAINEALGQPHWQTKIITPLMMLSKADSIRMAMGLPGCMDALAYSHTAYDNAYPPNGKDHASTLRAQGFLEAGVPDPLIVRAVFEGLMDLPPTPNYNDLRDIADKGE